MALVVFAFGSKPVLSERQAIEVADLLGQRRNLAAASLARAIRLEASFGFDARHAAREVDPTAQELGELIAVLGEGRWPIEQPAFEELLREAVKAPGRDSL